VKDTIKWLLGHHPSPTERVGLDALERDWTFRPSRPDGVTRAVRLLTRRGRRPAPAHLALVPVTPSPRWIAYFVFLPAGGLTAAHRFTLDRLRAADAKLCVICAAPTPGDVPDALARYADALYWKALPGFDFSAYALAVRVVAAGSPGADLLVLNDSVWGPFVPVDSIWPAMRWDLTGFTASAQIQNHVQSYAFHLRGVTPATAHALRPVLPAGYAYDDYRGAVYRQESRFATVGARSMTVGALWYADGVRCGDPSVLAALPLVRQGFPFLKRSLLGKNGHIYPRAQILATLRDLGHPVDDLEANDPGPGLPPGVPRGAVMPTPWMPR
jgi:lipopolysaccharide biosynthesis protein